MRLFVVSIWSNIPIMMKIHQTVFKMLSKNHWTMKSGHFVTIIYKYYKSNKYHMTATKSTSVKYKTRSKVYIIHLHDFLCVLAEQQTTTRI